jgi:hypothetical protein
LLIVDRVMQDTMLSIERPAHGSTERRALVVASFVVSPSGGWSRTCIADERELAQGAMRRDGLSRYATSR